MAKLYPRVAMFKNEGGLAHPLQQQRVNHPSGRRLRKDGREIEGSPQAAKGEGELFEFLVLQCNRRRELLRIEAEMVEHEQFRLAVQVIFDFLDGRQKLRVGRQGGIRF